MQYSTHGIADSIFAAMTTKTDALCVASILIFHGFFCVVNTNKHMPSSAAGDNENHGTAAAAAVATNEATRHATRHNLSSLNSAASLLCDGKHCHGKITAVSQLMHRKINFVLFLLCTGPKITAENLHKVTACYLADVLGVQ